MSEELAHVEWNNIGAVSAIHPQFILYLLILLLLFIVVVVGNSVIIAGEQLH